MTDCKHGLDADRIVVNVIDDFTVQLVALDDGGGTVTVLVSDALLDDLIYDLGDAQFTLAHYVELTKEDG